eukprot:4238775-Lingulodinium_polyedra.AAC.2
MLHAACLWLARGKALRIQRVLRRRHELRHRMRHILAVALELVYAPPEPLHLGPRGAGVPL